MPPSRHPVGSHEHVEILERRATAGKKDALMQLVLLAKKEQFTARQPGEGGVPSHATEAVLRIFEPEIERKAKANANRNGIPPGHDIEDVKNIARADLAKSLRNFDPEKLEGLTPQEFFQMVMQRRSLNTFRSRYARQSARMELQPDMEENADGEKPVAGTTTSPEQEHLFREDVLQRRDGWLKRLSPLERDVHRLFKEGHSYTSIAEALGIKRKSVDTALTRVRRKLAKLDAEEKRA